MNKKIETLAKQLLDEIEKENSSSKLEKGSIATVAGYEWLILKVEDDKIHCVCNELLEDMQFDTSTNNWQESSLREYLNNDFCGKIVNAVGENKIHTITTDLLSLDGQTEYGTCEDKISLLTVDLYRENRNILPNKGKWWWLATPFSTKCNGYENTVCVVSPYGDVYRDNCDSHRAVRPFCIFDSSIFES